MDRTSGSYTKGSGIGNSLELWKLFSFFFSFVSFMTDPRSKVVFSGKLIFFLQNIKAINSSFLAICKDQLELWIYVNNSKFKDWIKKALFIYCINRLQKTEFSLTHFQTIKGLDISALPEIHKLSRKSLSWHFSGNFDNFSSEIW